MKLKLTYQKIINLDEALKAVGENRKNAKFSLLVARNRFALREHIETITEAGKTSVDMKKADTRKRDLFNDFAEPDESGKMVVSNEVYPKFKKAVDELKKELKPIDDAHEQQMEAYEALLSEYPSDTKGKPVLIDFYEITESMLPKELSGNQIEGIMPVLKLK